MWDQFLIRSHYVCRQNRGRSRKTGPGTGSISEQPERAGHAFHAPAKYPTALTPTAFKDYQKHDHINTPGIWVERPQTFDFHKLNDSPERPRGLIPWERDQETRTHLALR